MNIGSRWFNESYNSLCHNVTQIVTWPFTSYGGARDKSPAPPAQINSFGKKNSFHFSIEIEKPTRWFNVASYTKPFLYSCMFSECHSLESFNITYYYSFKIFSRFWLVKTTSISHHNQLLFAKFGKNLRHIESMTSKVQPATDYWTVDRENLGTRLCYIWWAEKQRA